MNSFYGLKSHGRNLILRYRIPQYSSSGIGNDPFAVDSNKIVAVGRWKVGKRFRKLEIGYFGVLMESYERLSILLRINSFRMIYQTRARQLRATLQPLTIRSRGTETAGRWSWGRRSNRRTPLASWGLWDPQWIRQNFLFYITAIPWIFDHSLHRRLLRQNF